MSSPVHVLLAEDEAALGMIIKESLETRDFKVSHCMNGVEAIEFFEREDPDILVLDVMMPKLDGFALAEKVRKKDKQVPIIFLTSRSRTEDVVEGFGKGGNDYLKKPFSMEELIVRINELLRRSQSRPQTKELTIGQFTFDPIKQQLFLKDKQIEMTHRESKLLQKLAASPNELVDRSEILKEVWGSDDFHNGRSMDVFITRLRKKLAADSEVQIVNVRGFGYKLVC